MLIFELDSKNQSQFVVTNVNKKTVSNDFSARLYELSTGNTIQAVTYDDLSEGATSLPFSFPTMGVEYGLSIFTTTAQTMNFSGNNSIVRVSGTLPKGLLHCRNMFKNAAYMTYVDESIFSNCVDVKDFSYAFYRCLSLSTIPAGIFSTCSAAKTLDSTFMGCSAIHDIPATLLDACNVNDMYYAFANCSGITGAVPEYWTNAAIAGSRCFWNCTGAANYNSIPATWK